MAGATVHTLDLNFQGRKHTIASYLIHSGDAVVLIECGPGSTKDALQAGLRDHGLSVKDLTHVLLTHIHLDHAGAAGWLARQGAQVFVHSVGAPHLLNPEKLIASATRIYGDQMDALWGEFLSVPEEKLTVPQDRQEIAIGALRFVPLDTPGHAEHHFAYLFEDLCFSGDVGGVRIPDQPDQHPPFLRLPMPPPEFHIAKWRASLQVLNQAGFKRIAPTHFGIFDDAPEHLRALEAELLRTEKWIEAEMPSDPPIEKLRDDFTAWTMTEARGAGVGAETLIAYSLANPLGMSADGIQRYWRKVRQAA
jgi:glyoxylase-like metal-dependent hydrolase (beta-lactamase superfamily II)